MGMSAIQYEAKTDAALNNAETKLPTSYEKGVAWTSISAVYSFLEKEQESIETENVLRTQAGTPLLVVTSKALGYQTKAEELLAKAEKWATGVIGFALDPPRAAVTAELAHKWAYRYSQTVRNKNKVV